MKNFFAILAAIIFLSGNFLSAQDSASTKAESPRHIIYPGYAMLIVSGVITLNYEYMLSDNFSARAAYFWGYGMKSWEFNFLYGEGGLLMLNYLVFPGRNKLELGFGASLANISTWGMDYGRHPGIAWAIAYRYQKSRGFFFRAGISGNKIFMGERSVFYGGLDLSAGYSF